MKVIERNIREVYPGKFEELDILDAKFTEIEDKLGFPPKKNYRCIAGFYDQNTIVLERKWESLAKMEEAFAELMLVPEVKELLSEIPKILKSQRRELYTPHAASLIEIFNE
ncbi:MAG: hypothetical protein ACFFD7_10365 [Candidatus Thorarchaeota archaeon]